MNDVLLQAQDSRDRDEEALRDAGCDPYRRARLVGCDSGPEQRVARTFTEFACEPQIVIGCKVIRSMPNSRLSPISSFRVMGL